MKGKIIGFTPSAGTGAISGGDGERYAFEAAQWRSEKPIAAGTSVDFVGGGGSATEIYPVAGAALGSVDVSELAASPVVQKLKALLTGTLAFPLALVVIFAFFMPAISSPVQSASFMGVGKIAAMLNMNQFPGSDLESLKTAATQLDTREAQLKLYLAEAAARAPAGQSATTMQDYQTRDAQTQLEALAESRVMIDKQISAKRSAATKETLLALRFLAPLLAVFLLWRAWSGAPLRVATLATGAAALIAGIVVWSFTSSIDIGGALGPLGAMLGERARNVFSVGFGVWLMLACGIGLVLAGLGVVKNPLASKVP